METLHTIGLNKSVITERIINLTLIDNDRSRVCFHDGENLELTTSKQPT